MTTVTRDTNFKPSLTKAESKADTVSRIAMSMIEHEAAHRDAKLARLRQERLAREAAEVAVPVAPAKAKPKAAAAGEKKKARPAIAARAS
ncbi:hypothetical protein MKI84_07965 [Ancylobacter sp. A5.8]|uniref:hypothetical protein n=1 Tax=Ancylobacter gelatini TaxID=2919920 RepID=UPI001F4D5E07|nr:hypothetical protein [Ancylobacter gelatini]MCJ8142852.1 hypothetical protein [Ancylobacter gelatini]